MYDSYAPCSLPLDGDGFPDLMRRLDRAEPLRARSAAVRELDFDEELHFGERRRLPKRPHTEARRQRPVPTVVLPRPVPALRLVPKPMADENLAIAGAQLHAREESRSWKDYVENMDRFLEHALAFEKAG